MTQTDFSSLYEGRKKTFASSLEEVKKSISNLSTARLLVAVVFFAAIYFSIDNHGLALILPVLITIFTLLVKNQEKKNNERIKLQNLVNINEQELAVLHGSADSLAPGVEFINVHHPYAHDLDLFGDGSLFQYINRSNTPGGKERLASSLITSLESREAIEKHQAAIKEIAPKLDFRQNVQAGGMEIKESAKDREQLFSWLQQPAFLKQKTLFKYLIIILPALTVLSIVLAFFIAEFEGITLALVATQLTLAGTNLKRINLFHDYISRKKNILEKYARILDHIASEKFEADLLKDINKNSSEAAEAVRKLALLVNDLDARANFLMGILVNSVFLYDIRCVYRLERWKEKYADHLVSWLDSVSEVEAVSSWGTFSFNHPEFAFPKIQDELKIEARSLAHPLINRKERVSNNVLIGDNQRIQLITGANMAGKSTFLRSIGVNVVLALAGAPVCAEEFRCPILGLRSGMRTADSLKDHQSYFFAELDRLKTIMEELRREKPLLVLLDEILKGTNSTDKLSGSIAMVKQLIPHPCLALIATHDLALGELEVSNPQAVRNFCFEANIENDQLSFDYKLKNGLATKMNATFLMKKMGIIPA